MSEDIYQTDVADAPQLPGGFLRAAREAQGLTIGEVAGVTKFSPRQIEALENDDFAQLQGLTFQRGFVRAYARMLKLDPAPLLSMLDNDVQPAAELVVPPDNMGETNPKPFYRKHFKALVVLCIVALGVLAAASLKMSPYFKTFSTEAQTAGSTVAAAATGMTTVAIDPVHEAATTTDVAIPIEGLSATAIVPVVADSLSATLAPVPVVAVPALRFEFSDISWLEVKDGDEQIILTGEFAGGVVKTVSKGKPPFQIWVGKASVVKVSYQGQPVDIQPHTREDVARLTLGH